MLRRLKRLAVIVLAACAAAAAGPVAAASAQDDCGGAAYCLPLPPADAAVKQRGAKKAKRSLGVAATVAGQVGSALVYAPRGGIVTPRPGRAKRASVPAVSVYCPSRCTVTGSLSLRIGRRTAGQPGLSASLRAGGATARRITLSRATLRRIVRAGEATLTVQVRVADAYGTHEQSVAIAVHPARRG